MSMSMFKVSYEYGIYDRTVVVDAVNTHNDDLNAMAAIDAAMKAKHIREGDTDFRPVSVEEYMARWHSWVTIWEAPLPF